LLGDELDAELTAEAEEPHAMDNRSFFFYALTVQ